MKTTTLEKQDIPEPEIKQKICSVTVRDVSKQTFLPFLAEFLQESKKVNYEKFVQKIISSQTTNQAYLAALEKWYCEIAASTLHQLYLHPSFEPTFQKARGGSQAANLAKAQKIAQRVCIKELIEVGWIIKDRTGIMLVTQEGIEKMDSIANQISQRNTKDL